MERVKMSNEKLINVTILGESSMPGIYPIHPFSTIFTALLQTGGIAKTGSLRDIQLIRGNEKLSSLDLYNYFLNGNINNNQRY